MLVSTTAADNSNSTAANDTGDSGNVGGSVLQPNLAQSRSDDFTLSTGVIGVSSYI